MTPEEHAFMRDQAAHEAQEQLLIDLRKALGMATLPRDVTRAVVKAKAALVRIGQMYARQQPDEDEITGVFESSPHHRIPT